MVRRSDIVWLGISTSVAGALVGGLMLGVGMDLVANKANIGFLLIIPGAPAAGLVGWLFSRRLASRFPK